MENGPVDTKREFGALAHTLRALEQRDPVATIPLRCTLKRLHVGGLLPSTSKALMEFAAKDVARLAHRAGAALTAPAISMGCSRPAPESDRTALQRTGEGGQ